MDNNFKWVGKKYLFAVCFTIGAFSLLMGQQTVGLFANDSLSFNGYTLFAPSSNRTTYLIDNCGYQINTWRSNFSPGVSAYLLPNGNLLRTIRVQGSFQGGGIGGGIEIYNWEGDLLWSYVYASASYHQHHDVEMLPNGNILILAWEKRTQSDAIESGRNPLIISGNGLWPEHIVEVKPIGTNEIELIWEWHLWDHLIQDFDSTKLNYGVIRDHPELVDINFTGSSVGGLNADWIHANAIDYNPELDQIVISSRIFSEFWVIDHSTTTAETAGHTGGRYGKGGDLLYRWGNPYSYKRGNPADQKLYGQHDIHWIESERPDEGKFMCFNNGAGRPGGNYSTVEVIDPPVDSNGFYTLNDPSIYGPQNADWTYTADPPSSLFSSNVSGAQRLPNGNTLICEGNQGSFIEVNELGKVVWEYINPVSGNSPVSQGTNPFNNAVFRAYRYAPEYGAFDGRDLSPGDKVELNPIDDNCVIFNDMTTGLENLELTDVTVFPNPIDLNLNIRNPQKFQLSIECIKFTGEVVRKDYISNQYFHIKTDAWPVGLYAVRVVNLQNQNFKTFKIVKQ